MAEVICEIRHLVKDYPGVRAVNDASIAIYPGEVVGLVGKNGAGKSTVIKVLAGAVHPDAGEIYIEGELTNITDPHRATTLGLSFVHQELSVVPELSVAENVELGLGYPTHGGIFVDFGRLQSRATDVLQRLSTNIDPRAPIGSLSMAQQRLCMIARALVTDARMVLLDEPTASLTDEEITHLHEVVRDLVAHDVAVVYVSHRLDEIFEITDRVVVMRDGAVVADQLTSEFDVTTLIEEITGSDASATSLERRRHLGIGGPPDSAEVLRVEGVSVPGRVFDAGFSIRRGEILGVAGLVGSGRTELMRAVIGVDPSTGGQVWMHGEPVRIRRPKDAIRAGIVLLPEDRRRQGLVLDFSIRSNLTLPTLRQHRTSPMIPVPSQASERDASRRTIDILDIKASSDTIPAAWLSGGNQQKLVLGRWIEHHADVLIFDEPTHGVDVGAKEEIYAQLERLADEGKAIVFISSEFPELVGVCHRVLVMREGRVVGELNGDEITERRLLEHCYGHAEATDA